MFFSASLFYRLGRILNTSETSLESSLQVRRYSKAFESTQDTKAKELALHVSVFSLASSPVSSTKPANIMRQLLAGVRRAGEGGMHSSLSSPLFLYDLQWLEVAQETMVKSDCESISGALSVWFIVCDKVPPKSTAPLQEHACTLYIRQKVEITVISWVCGVMCEGMYLNLSTYCQNALSFCFLLLKGLHSTIQPISGVKVTKQYWSLMLILSLGIILGTAGPNTFLVFNSGMAENLTCFSSLS